MTDPLPASPQARLLANYERALRAALAFLESVDWDDYRSEADAADVCNVIEAVLDERDR